MVGKTSHHNDLVFRIYRQNFLFGAGKTGQTVLLLSTLSSDVVQFREKFSFRKKVLLPNILLQFPTVHYGCYLQGSLRCELYNVSTTLWFFAISHLAIIMKSDHHQKQPSSTATPHISTVHYGLQKNVG